MDLGLGSISSADSSGEASRLTREELALRSGLSPQGTIDMPGRGRPPKPTRILEMSGSFKRNPKRRRERANEPESGKLFASAPPAEFLIAEPAMGYQRAARLLREWNQLALEGPDISYASRGTIISLCMIKADMWRLPEGSKRLSQLTNTEDKLRSSLGLTEVSRPKVNAANNRANGNRSGLAGLAQERREPRRA